MDKPGIINTVIQNRRSIYPYQYEAGAEVDDAIVKQILENANKAPNHKKTMPWRFTVYGREGRKQFADLQTSLYIQNKGSENKIKIKKLQDYPLMASHVIAIGLKRHGERVPEVEEILAVGCAIENMFLTATAYGLGCYLSTGGITYIEGAKELFGLEAEDRLIGFFYIGKIKDAPKEMQRSPVEEKITWVG
ncbi:MAG: nitroreductase [Chitinophagaceae bacterium]|nr:nitroreductase [Chitinophagaceae bacterium]